MSKSDCHLNRVAHCELQILTLPGVCVSLSFLFSPSPSLYNLSFNAGYIDDFILTVHFNPSLTSAKNMLYDHLAGKLLLDILFNLDTSVLVSRFTHPVLQLNTTYVLSNLDAEGEAERKYCKCQQPNVNSVDTSLVTRIGRRFEQASTSVLQKAILNAFVRIEADLRQSTQIESTHANGTDNDDALTNVESDEQEIIETNETIDHEEELHGNETIDTNESESESVDLESSEPAEDDSATPEESDLTQSASDSESHE